MIIFNSFQPLTVITKYSILDVAAVLDPPHICYSRAFLTMRGCPINNVMINVYFFALIYLNNAVIQCFNCNVSTIQFLSIIFFFFVSYKFVQFSEFELFFMIDNNLLLILISKRFLDRLFR